MIFTYNIRKIFSEVYLRNYIFFLGAKKPPQVIYNLRRHMAHIIFSSYIRER